MSITVGLIVTSPTSRACFINSTVTFNASIVSSQVPENKMPPLTWTLTSPSGLTYTVVSAQRSVTFEVFISSEDVGSYTVLAESRLVSDSDICGNKSKPCIVRGGAWNAIPCWSKSHLCRVHFAIHKLLLALTC